MIHPTAIIDPSAIIDPTAQVGAYCIIGENVVIGAESVLSHHVSIAKNTTIGKRNRIYQFASLGDDPQDLKYQGECTHLVIGDDNTIRESCTFHRGTADDKGVTVIGDGNLFMVNTHIAHDCVIGNQNIIANNVGLAGHVVVGDYVVIGGNCGVHQFCRIDSYSMVAAASLIVKDVVACVMVGGNPAKAYGLNKEGMKRKNWDKQTVETLNQAYRIIYRLGLTTTQALEQLSSLACEPKVQLMMDSLRLSKRGITR